MKYLILGGARSGKSRYAEESARASGKALIYIATAGCDDDEMAIRIDTHKQRRDSQWHLIEEHVHLAAALETADAQSSAVVVDCLTLWLSNCLHQNCFDYEKKQLLDVLPRLKADIFLVSNEVGSGVVPLGQLSRQFVDCSGWLHQDLALVCDKVSLVVAGLPLNLK